MLNKLRLLALATLATVSLSCSMVSSIFPTSTPTPTPTPTVTPTPIETPTPTPTATPTPLPDLSGVVIQSSDVPVGFERASPSQVNSFEASFEQSGGLIGIQASGFTNTNISEGIMGVVGILATKKASDDLDGWISNPGATITSMAGSNATASNISMLTGLKDIGDASGGAKGTLIYSNGSEFQVEVLFFRRNHIAAIILSTYQEGVKPQIPIIHAAQLIDQRAQAIPTQAFETTIWPTEAPASFGATADAIGTATARANLIASYHPIASDDFSSITGNWDTGKYDDSYAKSSQSITGGVFSWDVQVIQGILRQSLAHVTTPSDFHLVVSARRVSGPTTAEYGLTFAFTSKDDFYLFTVSDEGKAYVGRWSGGKWENMIVVFTSVVKKAEFNELSMDKQGSSASFYVNGTSVGSISLSQSAGNGFGLAIQLFNPGDTAVFEFDSFDLSGP